MLIAIEGLDGAGKTTVALLLARELDAVYTRTPPEDMTLVSDRLLREGRSVARYLYYLGAVAAVSERSAPAELVVADRYVASARALHYWVEPALRIDLLAFGIREPDLTFYLDVPETDRRARLAFRKRPLDPFEELLEADDQVRAKVDELLRSGPNTIVVPTLNRSAVDVTRTIMGLIRGNDDALRSF